MSSTTDTYAGWRAALRDTLKWYVAALSGLGATLAGGLTLAILPDLKGDHLTQGILLGLLAIALILIGIWRVQSILFQRPFARDRVFDPDISPQLAPYLSTLLPGDISDVRALDQLLVAEEAKDQKNIKEIKRLEALRSKVTSYAASLELQQKVDATNRLLLVLFFGIIISVAALTHVRALSKASDTDAIPIVFSPGQDWANYARILAETCGSGRDLPAMGTVDQPFDGWWSISLEGPDCAGVTLAVPAAVVQPSD